MERDIEWPGYDDFPMPLTRQSVLVQDAKTGQTFGAIDLTTEEINRLKEQALSNQGAMQTRGDERAVRYEAAVIFVLENELELRDADQRATTG